MGILVEDYTGTLPVEIDRHGAELLLRLLIAEATRLDTQSAQYRVLVRTADAIINVFASDETRRLELRKSLKQVSVDAELTPHCFLARGLEPR